MALYKVRILFMSVALIIPVENYSIKQSTIAKLQGLNRNHALQVQEYHHAWYMNRDLPKAVVFPAATSIRLTITLGHSHPRIRNGLESK